ncbi:hypothetical protein SDC9_210400 [bioreactor metagenome]|uniref:Uncharacterized protein n=1 Tax=bioreactor metagenome TaxID=1076179 RepID=A0A645JG19_9ZZZZ
MRRAPDFPDLEDVDPKGFPGSQGKQQDFHLVRAGQLGAGIDAFQQVLLFSKIHGHRPLRTLFRLNGQCGAKAARQGFRKT